MLNYTDGRNYTYSPSWFVVILHRMPHFNEYAINHEADFDGGNSDEAKAYQNSLIGDDRLFFPAFNPTHSVTCVPQT